MLSALPPAERRMVAGIACEVIRQPNQEWWVVPMGVGPARATATAKALCAQHAFRLIVSAGFACALDHAAVGDVLIGTDVVLREDERAKHETPCDLTVAEEVALAGRQAGLPVHCGRFVTVPTVLCRAAEKLAVARQEKGIGLDMESAALGAVAREHRIPFTIVRTVSDLLEEDLPLDFNLFLRPSGWLAGIAACVTRPSCLIGLNRLRRQSREAGRHLTAVYRAWAGLSAGRRA